MSWYSYQIQKLDHLSSYTPSFNISFSLAIIQSRKEVIPSSPIKGKINECFVVFTEWQVLVEERVTSSEATPPDTAFLPPASSRQDLNLL